MEEQKLEEKVLKKKKYVYPKEYIAEKNKKYYEKNKEKLLLHYKLNVNNKRRNQRAAEEEANKLKALEQVEVIKKPVNTAEDRLNYQIDLITNLLKEMKK